MVIMGGTRWYVENLTHIEREVQFFYEPLPVELPKSELLSARLFIMQNQGQYRICIGKDSETYQISPILTDYNVAVTEQQRIKELLESGAHVVITGSITFSPSNARVEPLEDKVNQVMP